MFKKLVTIAAAFALLAGCGSRNEGGNAVTDGALGVASSLSGAGATFPAPLYAKWAEEYHKAAAITVNYQAIGSGGGIKQIEANTVDFGASDKPLKPEDLDKKGLYQFPTVVGGVVPVVNLPGVQPGQLKLTGQLLGDIFLGTVKRWDAPEIKALNAGVTLPALPITVVHRSDGSGTSFLFTTYLSLKNMAWKDKVGASDSVNWPTGLGGKGNDGVSAFVKQTQGSIGYVEYAYAKQNGAITALLQNQAGKYPAPKAEAFAAAASDADWAHAPGNYLLLLDQPGEGSWPITGATFILLHKDQVDPAKAQAILRFFDWAYDAGDPMAASLDYVPLPKAVKDLVRGQWAASIRAGGQPIYPF